MKIKSKQYLEVVVALAVVDDDAVVEAVVDDAVVDEDVVEDEPELH